MSGEDDELSPDDELAILLLADRLNRMTSTLRELKARLSRALAAVPSPDVTPEEG